MYTATLKGTIRSLPLVYYVSRERLIKEMGLIKKNWFGIRSRISAGV